MNAPPVIRRARKVTPAVSPAWVFTGLLGLLAVARLSVEWDLPLPLCGLKRLTGVPCPFCGSTRCFQACSSFDFADALRWNPLTFLACCSIALWFAIWAADYLFQQRWLATVQRRLAVPALKHFLIGAGLANWIYLCLTLR